MSSDEPLQNESPTGDEAVEPGVTVDRPGSVAKSWIITMAVIVLVVALAVVWIVLRRGSSTEVSVNANTSSRVTTESDENTIPRAVTLSDDELKAANLQIETVTVRPAVAPYLVSGTVEINPQQNQTVASLVGGRVEEVFASIGDRVGAGQTLAILTSTDVADMFGKLRTAETRASLAERNLARARQSENRVGVLQAKAKLDEAQATLRRTKRLIELGAGAGKDLIAAQTAYDAALADYNYQNAIPLNKEIQEAQAEVENSRTEMLNLRQSLQVLGLSPNTAASLRSSARVPLVSPLSGIVTERQVNRGSGVQAGQPLFALSDVSTVWVTANVPQDQMSKMHVGMPAEISTDSMRMGARVSYIDPRLSEDTRTARVRLTVSNTDDRFKAGMFVNVGFQIGTETSGQELVVPTDAVQRISGRTVVFMPGDEQGEFEVREISVGAEQGGFTKVLDGLKRGDRVVTRGSFTLKAQLQKGSLADPD